MAVPEHIHQGSRSITRRLRTETRALHERLEQRLPFFHPDFDLDTYRSLICRAYGFYVPWEDSLNQWFRGLYHTRMKLPQLRDDLNFLGVDSADLPICSFFPQFNNLAEALGSFYVIEGATLGGVILARHVEDSLGLENGAGYSFLRGYGPDTSEKWRSFQFLLTSAFPTYFDDGIVNGAIQTFCAYDLWLEETAW